VFVVVSDSFAHFAKTIGGNDKGQTFLLHADERPGGGTQSCRCDEYFEARAMMRACRGRVEASPC
jgi:hypothetical protein